MPQSTKRTLAGLVILNALACLIWSSLACRSDDRSDIRGHIWRTRSRRRCTTSRPPASRRTTYLSRAGKVPKRTAVRNGCCANQIECPQDARCPEQPTKRRFSVFERTDRPLEPFHFCPIVHLTRARPQPRRVLQASSCGRVFLRPSGTML